MDDTRKRTDFLFPKRDFWTGFSSVLDIFASDKKFNSSKSGEDADFKAIRNDWEMVGQDFKDTLSKLT